MVCEKKQGIKVYVFNLNYELKIDEEYVAKHEMDQIYGVYADDWDF